MIFAQSPQARGCVERTAGTFQDRLATELRLAGASGIEEATGCWSSSCRDTTSDSGFPRNTLSPHSGLWTRSCAWNRSCASSTARKWPGTTRCGSNCTLQLLTGPERPSYAGAALEVLKGLDGRLSVRHEGSILAAQEVPPSPVFLRNGHGCVLYLFLSRPPATTAWANAGPRPSNNWTQGSRTRRIKGTTITARPPPKIPKPPPRASRHSCKWRGGRRSRKPGAMECRFERSSGNWGSTGAPLGNTWTPRVPQTSYPGRIPRRQLLLRYQPDRVTFMLDTYADIYPERRHYSGTFCRRP